jgi:CRISPR-associated protein Cas5h
MLETIKFELSSRMAIIKKPDSNETYYTYTFPHKIMIYGILGAIIGLNGYNYYSLKKCLKEDVEELPEFYSKLCNLKIAIVPYIDNKNFKKKIQSFNNSVGYASQEQGNNLIVKEQCLENPKWDIYIMDNNSDEYNKIKEYLLNRKCEYIPYIGKNDHFANIKNVEVFNIESKSNSEKIDSIFNKDILADYIDDFDEMFAWNFTGKKDKEYEYTEVNPTKLNEKIGYTNFEQFIFTNKSLKIKENSDLFLVNGKIIYYF